MTTKLEEIARAMCIADGLDPDSDCRRHGNYVLDVSLEHPEMWRTYIRKALAAVRAMREPSEAMRRAFNDAAIFHGETTFDEQWGNAIDAILSEAGEIT